MRTLLEMTRHELELFKSELADRIRTQIRAGRPAEGLIDMEAACDEELARRGY